MSSSLAIFPRPSSPARLTPSRAHAFGLSDPGAVRTTNEDCYAVAPALGLILKSLSVPWYSATAGEPALLEMARSPESAIASLDDAANPLRLNGNSGLKREARATRRFVQRPDVLRLIDAVSDARAAARFVHECGFGLGKGMARKLEAFL